MITAFKICVLATAFIAFAIAIGWPAYLSGYTHAQREQVSNQRWLIDARNSASNWDDTAYSEGYHYDVFGQHIEIRGQHKYPLHLREDGSLEIESGGHKMMAVVWPPDLDEHSKETFHRMMFLQKRLRELRAELRAERRLGDDPESSVDVYLKSRAE